MVTGVKMRSPIRTELLLCLFLLSLDALDCKFTPRVILPATGEGYVRYEFPRPQEHIVFLHGQEDGTLYVGGQNKLFNINFKSLNQSTVIPFPLEVATGYEGRCDVTVLHRYDDSHLFVCGSDGESPQCYMMTDTWNSSEKVNPAGISPFSTNEKAPSLFVEGELYTTSRLYKEGNGKDLRRSWGIKKKVWMHDKSKKDPKYIGITSVSRKEDPLNDKIYTFFQEKNPDISPDADPWISRVAQVCKVDQGGSRSILHSMWTSFLKARLACGVPSENMFYNRLEEMYVLHAENWTDSRVYGVFSSAWNMTAVCIYSMEEIDSVFTHSKFQGYSGVIPNPRPGTCVDNSQALKDDVLKVAKDHPEMSDWIHPIVKAAPFMISDRRYRKIQVDRVTVPGQKPHNVLLLATESGLIHKVLEVNHSPFIIAEIHPFKSESHIQSMILDSTTKKLYVGSHYEVVAIDLQNCEQYGDGCEQCILSRDPYCGWSNKKCAKAERGAVQHVEDGDHSQCTQIPKFEHYRSQRGNPEDQELKSIAPLSAPYFLSCPMTSHHASHSWHHNNRTIDCQFSKSDCLHLIEGMKPDLYGKYQCFAEEKGYQWLVTEYTLMPSSGTTALSSKVQVLGSIILLVGLIF
ncbi:semaphorin-7A-like [Huso huso]|uniref:Semaphorin-7A-like n=1 Tax=Huso huso TaxID=61971 RepID=A0ABR0YVL9_HUSHU